jgi:cytochrome c-type biogenesis protein CcmE
MAQAAWEKPQEQAALDARRAQLARGQRSERLKFLIGGLLILTAVIALVFSGMLTGTRFFISVEELLADPAMAGQSVRITGAVIGPTINIDTSDPSNTIIEFTVAHVATNPSNLADALNVSANDPGATQLKVYVSGQPKPELLQHEAQAILTGTLGEDGVFYASAMQFKCPSRFEDGGPRIGEDHPGVQSVSAGA